MLSPPLIDDFEAIRSRLEEIHLAALGCALRHGRPWTTCEVCGPHPCLLAEKPQAPTVGREIDLLPIPWFCR